MNPQEASGVLFHAVKTGRIRPVIEAVYDILKHPVIITDSGFRLLTGVCPSAPTGNRKWDSYLGRESLDLTALQAFLEHDYVSALQQPHPHYYNKGYFADSPQLCAPVLSGGRIRGYVAILCPEEDYSEELSDLLTVSADAVSIYMRCGRQRLPHPSGLQQAFVNALFEGKIRSEKEAAAWISRLHMDLRPGYILMAISCEGNREGVFHEYLASAAADAGMPVLVHQTEVSLCLLLYAQDGTEYSSSHVQEISEMASRLQYVCGVSQVFSDPVDLETYKKQAEQAMRLQLPASESSPVRYFRDLSLLIVLKTAAGVLGQKNCMHPAIPYLEEYDRMYAAEYLKTLREYLRNSCRSSETCESMHIHRNTLNYRINKIEHLTGIDLGNEYTRTHLSLSLLLLQMPQPD